MQFLKKIFLKPVTICISILIILIYGVISTTSMSLNLMPDMTIPMVAVSVTYVGADAEVVEEEVSDVLYDGLIGLSDVNSVSTYSMHSASMVVVEFEYGVDLEKKQEIIKEEVSRLDLPSECGEPNLVTIDFNAEAVITIALYSSSNDINQLYEEGLGLKNDLMNISGVGDVSLIGGPKSTIRINTINGLESFSLLIVQTLANGEYDIPLGSIEQNGEDVSINNNSQVSNIEDIKKLPINIELSNVYLSIFLSIQQALDRVEEVTTTDLDEYRVDIDKVNDFINELEESNYSDLDDMTSAISSINAIIYLIENNSATTLDYMWKSTIKDLVEDPDFNALTDDELHDLADDTGISYDLLVWVHDNSDSMESKWAMIVKFREEHPTEEDKEEIPNEEYVQLFYDLEIVSNDPESEDYLSEEDLLDVIELSRNINTYQLENVVEILKTDIELDKLVKQIKIAQGFLDIFCLDKASIQKLYDEAIYKVITNVDFLEYDDTKLNELVQNSKIDYNVWKWMQEKNSIDTKNNHSKMEDVWLDIIEFKENENGFEDYCDLFYDLEIFNHITDEEDEDYQYSINEELLESIIKLGNNLDSDLYKIIIENIENNNVRNYNEYLSFICSLTNYDKGFKEEKLINLVNKDEFKSMTYGQLEDYCKDNNLNLDLILYLQGKDTIIDDYKDYVNCESLVDYLYQIEYLNDDISIDLVNNMINFTKGIDLEYLNDYLEEINDLFTPTNEEYSNLFTDTDYNQSGIINGEVIGFIRSKYFEDNWNTFYDFKKQHQHIESIKNSDGILEDVYVGEELTSDELMHLYNKIRFEEELEFKLTSDMINFIRKSDFSSNTFRTTIGDISYVYEETTFEDAAYYNGLKCIQLNVFASTLSNNSEIAEAAKKIINNYESPNGSLAVILSDQSKFISESVTNAVVSLIIGAVLAVIVVYLFLRKIGTSLIIALTMPLSVLLALICLNLMGITLNMVSIGGLAVGIGMLVDNSIVVLESISSERDKGKNALEASLEGVRLVIGSLIGSTLTSICVFFPILFIGGLTKEIFRDLAWAVIFSLSFSLLCAVIFIPTLYILLYSKSSDVSTNNEGKYIKKMKEVYGKILDKVLRNRWKTLFISIGIFVASIGLIFLLDTEFLPSIDNGQIEINVGYSSIEKYDYCEKTTVDMADLVIENFEDDIDFTSVTVAKSGMTSSNISGVISIELKDRAKDTKVVVEEIRELINSDSRFENLSISVQAIDGVVATLTSGMAGTSVSLKGADIEVLDEIAGKVEEKLLTEYPEYFKYVSNDLTDRIKQYNLKFNYEKLAENNLTYENIVMTLRVGISGYTACTIGSDDKEVIISFVDDALDNYYEGFERYIVGYDSNGDIIRLSDVCDIKSRTSYAVINKTDNQNVVTITAETYNISTGTAGEIFDKVVSEVLSEEKYSGYTYSASGVSSYLNDAFSGLYKALIISLFLLVAVMACLFESFRKPFIIIFSFPFAFTGGFIALFIGGMSLNVVSFIGLIMLMGVIVNDAIVLVERINQMREEEGLPPYEAVVEGCKERLRAVLMTTVTTVFGLIPVSLAIGQGGELMQPLGVIVIGGMTIGTFVTLILIPTIHCLVHRVKKPVGEINELQ